ncbi:tetratricopeptide repeat protein [Loigolactobacillus iwatensis]|uniref:tetratricopeptide repeat protein n=1 Tax=Loigolactobacillus iwatensis TaxID=1267156 RepID=UPI000F7F7F00|nr:tetratricopeptide repeat protein [Loigolactobacillus iwatensis]
MGEVISFQPSCEFYFNLGMTAFSKNRYKKAIVYLERAQTLAQTDDDYVFANCQLAICLQYDNRYNEAISQLEQLNNHYGKNHPEIQYFLANCYAFMNQFEDSFQCVQRYLTSGQQEFKAEAMDLLSQLRTELGNF